MTRPFSDGEMISGTAYRVLGLIGRGGMGCVYQVEHAELGRQFVLKALHEHLAMREDLVGRMRNEWRALAKLHHPNIVQVTDAGTTAEGLPYFVMEYLQGQVLSELLRAEGKLGVRRSCQLIVGVLSGLSAAHKTGVVHRDIKPPNIFIAEDDKAKLLDFGIAKLRDRVAKVVTAGGVSIGTPRYMAPEQAEGGKVDGRADIYASALVLYECLVGRGPFAHISDPNQLVMAHIGAEPERADFADSRVPEELGDLLHRWLLKEPGSRPSSAAHAAQELESLAVALPDENDGRLEESTAKGSYDAVTVGGPSSHSFLTPSAGELGRGGSIAAFGRSRVSEPSSAPTATSTVSLNSQVGGCRADLRSSGGAGMSAPQTLAWGTPPADSGRHPPIQAVFSTSSRPAQEVGSQEGPSVLRLALVVALVSFFAVLLVFVFVENETPVTLNQAGEQAVQRAELKSSVLPVAKGKSLPVLEPAKESVEDGTALKSAQGAGSAHPAEPAGEADPGSDLAKERSPVPEKTAHVEDKPKPVVTKPSIAKPSSRRPKSDAQFPESGLW